MSGYAARLGVAYHGGDVPSGDADDVVGDRVLLRVLTSERCHCCDEDGVAGVCYRCPYVASLRQTNLVNSFCVC